MFDCLYRIRSAQVMYRKAILENGNGNVENWADSGVAEHSQQTDTSTDIDIDDKNQVGICILKPLAFKT